MPSHLLRLNRSQHFQKGLDLGQGLEGLLVEQNKHVLQKTRQFR